MTIPLAEPRLDGNEARYLAECITSGYVSSVGAFVERFERDFAAYLGTRHAVACNTGTAALHVALRLAGAGPGRLVAVSDFTFMASANAATYTGADILLVDSEPDTWNMDTEQLHDEVVQRARQGKRIPDIVEIVHVLGHPARMEPLLELRDRFDMQLIEDAAESLGASWTTSTLAHRRVGTAAQMGCFSFNGNKIITTGGGGMIATDDPELAASAKHLTTQAKRANEQYLHDTIGYNYRLTNIAAALGCAQLERLDEFVRTKRSIAARYQQHLADLPLATAPRATWANPSHWLYSVLMHDQRRSPDDVIKFLGAQGIQSRRLWPPLHHQVPYRRAERIGGQVAELIYQRGTSLPSSVTLTHDQQDSVVAGLQTALTSHTLSRR